MLPSQMLALALCACADHAALETPPGASLAQTLGRHVATRARTSGEASGSPVVRGAARPRVLVLDSGLPAEDFGWLEEDGPSIEPRFVADASVVHGPLAALQGANALLGGVVTRPPVLPAPGSPFRARLSFEAAGATRAGATHLHLEDAPGVFAWRLQAAGAGGGDLRTPDGRLRDTAFERWDGEIAAGVRGAAGRIELRYLHHGGAFDLLRDRSTNRVRDVEDDRVQIYAEHPVRDVRLEARAQWQRRRLEIAPGDVDLRLASGALDIAGHLTRGRWSGRLGVRGSERTWESHGATRLVPRAHGVAGAAFTQHAIRTGTWLWHAGVAFDLWHLDNDADVVLRLREHARNERRWSGGGGFVFTPIPALAFDVSAGRSTRAPTPFELFAKGPDAGGRAFVLGDPALEPESAVGIDAGACWRTEHVEMGVAGFGREVEDFAFQRQLPATRDGLPEATFLPGKARWTGGEARLRASGLGDHSVYATVEAVRGRDRTRDTALERMPPLRARLGALRLWDGWRHTEQLRTGIEVELVARSEAAPGEIETAPYALVHLYTQGARTWSGRRFTAALGLHNATNTRYHDPLSLYRTFAPAAGRDLRAHLGVEF